MKRFAAPAAFAAAALFGAVAAHAQGFASYDAYAPTHPEASYWFPRYAPAYAAARYEPGAPGYDAERPSHSGWRRGQHLPPDYRAEVVGDYAYRHLRRPPPGYAWYRDADDYILAAAASGRIASVINSAD